MLSLFAGANQAAASPPTITTWSGNGGSGSWSNASNWSTLPTTSGNWGFVLGGTTQTIDTNNIGTIGTAAMSFTNDGSAGKTSIFTLSGSTLALSSATITTTATSGGALANSGDIIANALSLTGANTVTLGAGHSLSLTTGGMSGSGSITYGVSGGTPTVYLSGSSNYSGGTTITGGQVQTAALTDLLGSNSNALGSGNVVISGSGSLFIRNSSSFANNFTIGGAGSTISGTTQGAIRGSFGAASQTAAISGTVTLSSNATIKTAASNLATDSKLLLSGPINLGANTLTLAPKTVNSGTAAVPIEITGIIGGTGAVVLDGESLSNVLLSGASNYSGGTTIVSGMLRVGNASALGTGGLAVNGGILDLNGQALAVGLLSGSSTGVIKSTVAGSASLTTNSASSNTYAGTIVDGVGVVSLTKNGSGTLFMTGSNGYSGTTYITGGKIQTGSNGIDATFNSNAFGTGSVVVSGTGTLAVRNSSDIFNNITISGSGNSGGTQGAIRGSFGGSSQTAIVSGAITLAADASITTAASPTLTGNKLLLSGPINLGAHTLTFAPAMAASSTTEAVSIVVTGTMSGTGVTVVNGASSVYLNGRNNSSGATTVQVGTLGGNGVIAGIVTVENGARLTPGSAANTTGSLVVGGLILNSGATVVMDISGTAVGLYDQVVAVNAVNAVNFGGALAIDFTQNGFANFDSWQLFSGASFGGHFASIAASGSYGDLTFSYVGTGDWKATGGLLGSGQSLSFYEDNTHAIGSRYAAGQLVLVPEPSTLALAGIGLLAAGWRSWTKRRALRRHRMTDVGFGAAVV